MTHSLIPSCRRWPGDEASHDLTIMNGPAFHRLFQTTTSATVNCGDDLAHVQAAMVVKMTWHTLIQIIASAMVVFRDDFGLLE